MAAQAPKRARPYRAFLTPALHRNFVRAGGLAFVLCYVEAIWMARGDFFWSWFPLGPAGARTFMLAMSVLMVMIIRVSRLHVGSRTTVSPFSTLRELLNITTFLTFFWYMMSAFLFAEVYVWARPVSEGFSLVSQGRAHDRTRLNERAVAFRTLFLCLGFVQALIHISSDLDRLPVPIRKIRTDPKTAPTLIPVNSPLTQLKQYATPLFKQVVWVSCIVPTISFLLYFLTPLRRLSWGIAFNTIRFVFFLPPAQRNSYTGFAPFMPFLWSLYSETVLLVALWEFTNAAFSAYISQSLLRKGHPLTWESTDPNGSLINGLKSKKEFTQASAFHELLLITVAYPDRRKAIYADLERSEGNAWTQISDLCLNQVLSITQRVREFNSAVAPATTPQPVELKKRDIAPPLKSGDIFAQTPGPGKATSNVKQWASNTIVQYGKQPGARPIPEAIGWGSQKLLTDEQRAALEPQALEQQALGKVEQVLSSSLGWLFRQSFSQQVTGVICGTPYSSSSTLVDAIDSLARLVVESIKEDVYGQVQKQVVTILRTYMSALSTIETFVRECRPHWTDVKFQESDRGNVHEVAEVREALRDGLAAILGAFGEYLGGMELSGEEIRGMKAAVGVAAAKPAAKSSVPNEKTKAKEMREIKTWSGSN